MQFFVYKSNFLDRKIFDFYRYKNINFTPVETLHRNVSTTTLRRNVSTTECLW